MAIMDAHLDPSDILNLFTDLAEKNAIHCKESIQVAQRDIAELQAALSKKDCWRFRAAAPPPSCLLYINASLYDQKFDITFFLFHILFLSENVHLCSVCCWNHLLNSDMWPNIPQVHKCGDGTGIKLLKQEWGDLYHPHISIHTVADISPQMARSVASLSAQQQYRDIRRKQKVIIKLNIKYHVYKGPDDRIADDLKNKSMWLWFKVSKLLEHVTLLIDYSLISLRHLLPPCIHGLFVDRLNDLLWWWL